eukprot:858426-Pleurochrysis_carterae.AAC.1
MTVLERRAADAGDSLVQLRTANQDTNYKTNMGLSKPRHGRLKATGKWPRHRGLHLGTAARAVTVAPTAAPLNTRVLHSCCRPGVIHAQRAVDIGLCVADRRAGVRRDAPQSVTRFGHCH